jgi:hypothetical protein
VQKRTAILLLSTVALATIVGGLILLRPVWLGIPPQIDPEAGAVGTAGLSDLPRAGAREDPGLVVREREPEIAITRVRASSGAAIGSALATWSAISPDWDADPSWPDRDWDALLASSTRATSDEQGSLAATAPVGAATQGSRLWISALGRATQVIEFAPGSESALPREIVMADAPTIGVHVVDASGQAAAGARVRTVYDLDPVDRHGADSEARDGLRYLVRDVIADAEGRAELPSLGSSQLCWARLGELESAVVRAAAPDRLRLELTQVTALGGRVVATDPLVELAGAEVSVYATTSSGGDRTLRARVRADGSFGPLRVPVVRGFEYAIQAQGPGFVVKTVPFDASGSSDSIEVEIPVVRGASVPIRVIEERPEVATRGVAGAYASAVWLDGLRWEKARGLTDDDGRVSVGRLPAHEVSFEVLADGFVPYEGRFVVTGDVQPYVELPLIRGSVLRGQVLDGSEPVREFTVHYWGDNVAQRKARAFRSRSDGTFQLDVPS